MYGLENPDGLNFFVGAEVIQVCVGPYDVIFNFQEQITFSIWSSFSCPPNEGRISIGEGKHVEHSNKLTQFLSSAVVEVFAKKDGTLRLIFNNGYALEVYDDNPKYEAYSIGWKNEEGLGESLIV